MRTPREIGKIILELFFFGVFLKGKTTASARKLQFYEGFFAIFLKMAVLPRRPARGAGTKKRMQATKNCNFPRRFLPFFKNGRLLRGPLHASRDTPKKRPGAGKKRQKP